MIVIATLILSLVIGMANLIMLAFKGSKDDSDNNSDIDGVVYVHMI